MKLRFCAFSLLTLLTVHILAVPIAYYLAPCGAPADGARKWLETVDFTEGDLDSLRNQAIDLLLELQP